MGKSKNLTNNAFYELNLGLTKARVAFRGPISHDTARKLDIRANKINEPTLTKEKVISALRQ